MAVVPSTAALIIISRIACLKNPLVKLPISTAICAGSVKVNPCTRDALPAIIMQPATVMVMQAPRNVSSRAHFTSAKRSRLSAMQLCWKKSCQGAMVVPTTAITRNIRSGVSPPGGIDGASESRTICAHGRPHREGDHETTPGPAGTGKPPCAPTGDSCRVTRDQNSDPRPPAARRGADRPPSCSAPGRWRRIPSPASGSSPVPDRSARTAPTTSRNRW